jgi:Spy/CpxP family protein refolding chaperone
MNKIMMIAITLIMAVGMLIAQPVDKVNPNVKVGPTPGMNENLKDRPRDVYPPMDMMQMLNLDKKQQEKLGKLRDDFQKNMNTKKAEIENLKIDLKNHMEAEDYAKAKTVTKQLFDKRLEIAYARIDHMQAMMKELNPEQKEIAKKMFARMRGRGHGMMGPRHGMGPGMGQGGQMYGPRNGEGKGLHNGDCDDCGDCGEHKGNAKPGNMHHNQQKPNTSDKK